MPIVRLSELLGQPGPATFLRGVVAGGRYANAYLLLGPAGVGKGTAALAFARALLCEGRAGAKRQAGLFDQPAPAPDADVPADDACGTCPARRKAAGLRHRNHGLLFPLSSEEDRPE